VIAYGEARVIEDPTELGAGFVLAAVPEIIQRLGNHPPDKGSKEVVRDTLEQINDIDSIYSRLSALGYEAKALEHYLS
jgi:hypothetical protein